MMFLADANTRDRDYGDVYVLAGVHRVSAVALREALRKVAEHRGREVRLLGPLLQTLRETRQQPWEAFRARSGLVGLPERFSDVVDAVVDFIDGVRDPDASRWDPAARRWE
jgi:Nucleotidyl transferase AbiEii toxin, Type IV TA system